MKKPPTTTMTIRVPVELGERLERLSEATSRTRSWLAADAIKRYVEHEEWQIAEIEAGLREADAGDFASEAEVNGFFERWTREG